MIYKKTKKTFMELLRRGKVSSSDIDNFIDIWHESNSELTLHEFLGMTEREYKQWVETSKLFSNEH